VTFGPPILDGNDLALYPGLAVSLSPSELNARHQAHTPARRFHALVRPRIALKTLDQPAPLVLLDRGPLSGMDYSGICHPPPT
jgi:hypothetical protein